MLIVRALDRRRERRDGATHYLIVRLRYLGYGDAGREGAEQVVDLWQEGAE